MNSSYTTDRLVIQQESRVFCLRFKKSLKTCKKILIVKINQWVSGSNALFIYTIYDPLTHPKTVTHLTHRPVTHRSIVSFNLYIQVTVYIRL